MIKVVAYVPIVFQKFHVVNQVHRTIRLIKGKMKLIILMIIRPKMICQDVRNGNIEIRQYHGKNGQYN